MPDNEARQQAKQHNYNTLVAKLIKDGFSRDEAIRLANIIMPNMEYTNE